MKHVRPLGIVIAAIAVVIPSTAVFAAPAAANTKIVYNSLAPQQGNIPSLGFEATSASEAGNEITLTRAATVGSVQVTMSSWGCQTGTGTSCVTTAGSTFSEPITLNIYNAPASDPASQSDIPGSGLPGSLIATVTKTFNIPYRPSANNTKCTGSEAGDYFYKPLKECFAGLMTNITFTALHANLPRTIVFGIAYNTSDYGQVPYGDATACHASTSGCGYDSLNVGLSEDPDNLQKGSDTDPGAFWWNTTFAGFYCDGGNAGTGTFRFDSPSTTPCWGVNEDTSDSQYDEAPWYAPAVQFIAS